MILVLITGHHLLYMYINNIIIAFGKDYDKFYTVQFILLPHIMQIFYQRKLKIIDVPPSVLPYVLILAVGSIQGTQLLYSIQRSEL